MVISLIIFRSSKEISVTPSCVYRDIGIYIFSTVFILVVSAFGEITVAISVCLLLIYLALILIVWAQDYFAAKEAFKPKEGEPINKAPSSSSQPVHTVQKHQPQPQYNQGGYYQQYNEEEPPTHKKPRKIPNIARKLRYHIRVMTIATKMVLLAKFKYREEQHYMKFEDRSIADKISFIIDFPFDIVRRLTIPPCEPDHFSKTWLILWPFPGLFLLAWVFFGTFSMVWIYVIIPVGIVLTLIFFFTCPDEGLPRYITAIEILGLLMSVVWTYIVSTILIDLLQMWTILSGLSATYMGLTIIAVGSALPDAVTTLALSTKGYGDMAITGNYSSQCFGFLVGFGLAMLKKTLTSGTQYFTFWDLDTLSSDALDVTAVLAMFTVLTVSFVYGIVRGFHFDKYLAWILISLYAIFLILATYFAIALLVAGTTD